MPSRAQVAGTRATLASTIAAEKSVRSRSVVRAPHVRRWHAHHHTSGTGPVYQGRFKSFPVLKPGGVISHISVPPMTQAPPRSDVEVKAAPVKYDTVLLEQLSDLVTRRAVQPVVTEVFAFGDAKKAFEHVMTGHARGKIMLDMTP